MTAPTSDALASALPAPIVRVDMSNAAIAEFQAERLAESGYVLVHTTPDEATVERLAEAHWREKWHRKYADWSEQPESTRDIYRRAVRDILAALADTSAQTRHTADDATDGDA